MSFEITATGITQPSASEIREVVVAYWREAYGTGAQTASDTPDGLMIDIITTLLFITWEGAVALYNNSFFGTAELDALIQILEPLGMSQIPAKPSTAELVLLATATTIVAVETLVRVGDTGGTFETDEEVTTAVGTLTTVVVIDADPPDGSLDLTVTHGGDVAAESFVASSSSAADAAQSLVNDLNGNVLFNANAAAFFGGEGTDGDSRVVIVSSPTAPSSVTIGGVTSDWGTYYNNTAVVSASADSDGVTPGPVGAIDNLLTPITNLDHVFNYIQAVDGREDETASELRARWLSKLASGGCATAIQIRAGLLELVDSTGESADITEVGINENESAVDLTPAGLPPHSFEAVVLQEPVGGPYTAAQDLLIAEEIYRCKPAGIQAYGDTVITVDGAAGPRDIGFSRVEALDLYMTVTVTMGEKFPTTGDPAAAIRDAIVEYYTTGAGKLRKGCDFEHATLGAPVINTIPQVSGIAATSGSVATGGPPPAEDASDEVITEDQILIVAAARTVIVLV